MTKLKKKTRFNFKKIEKLGKSLLFPISMLPIAAILLRVGSAIPTTTSFSEFIGQAFVAVGDGVLGPALPFLFAIGISFGMSQDKRGEAAIVGFSSMIILTVLMSDHGVFGGFDFVDKIYHWMILNGKHGFHGVLLKQSYNNILANNVFVGIYIGVVVAYIYDKFNRTELPNILGFFSGRRLVPVLAFVTILISGLLFAIIFPWFGAGLYYIGVGMGDGISNHWGKAGIMGAYGILNRMLLPFGLHHAINIPLWFSSIGGTQDGINGDINIFIKAAAKGNNSGAFQTGFFPIMMFGLPSIVVAIWYKAENKEQKIRVTSMFLGSALVSFFTGITEPLEFSFMFLTPLLYGLHIILCGVFGFIVGVFGIQLGFGFSAGLIDYVLSIPKSLDIIAANKTGIEAIMANPAWIIVIGVFAGFTYFYLSILLIDQFHLSTPGRKNNLLSDNSENNSIDNKQLNNSGITIRANKFVKAFGGYSNIKSFGHCTTRLRYEVYDMSKINIELMKKAGAFGVKKISSTKIQVIVGTNVEIIDDEIISGNHLTKTI